MARLVASALGTACLHLELFLGAFARQFLAMTMWSPCSSDACDVIAINLGRKTWAKFVVGVSRVTAPGSSLTKDERLVYLEDDQ